jgi:hypothetical protein
VALNKQPRIAIAWGVATWIALSIHFWLAADLWLEGLATWRLPAVLTAPVSVSSMALWAIAKFKTPAIKVVFYGLIPVLFWFLWVISASLLMRAVILGMAGTNASNLASFLASRHLDALAIFLGIFALFCTSQWLAVKFRKNKPRES